MILNPGKILPKEYLPGEKEVIEYSTSYSYISFSVVLTLKWWLTFSRAN